jgi:hypothetical protein
MLRAALLVMSLANSAAGIVLGSLYFRYNHDDGMPIIVLFVALSLLVQGGFTIGYLAGLWRRWQSASAQLFVIGEFAAGLVGSVTALQGILYNIHPTNGDYEFGPLMASVLMTAQAVLGLLYVIRSGEFPEGHAPVTPPNNS